ncbi:hypothetical protein ACFX1R_049243 [Malus domestica]
MKNFKSNSSLGSILNGVLERDFETKEDRISALSRLAFTCWFIWKARCNAVFNYVIPSHSQTIFAISSAMTAFHVARTSRLITGSVPGPKPCWSSSIKVNVDANWRRLDVPGHVGVVMRDSNSDCLAARQKQIYAKSALEAEALGILEGCVLARSKGCLDVM